MAALGTINSTTSVATGTGTATGTNTGDQTSIVGISGTTAEFNTALSDGSFATGGGTATGTNTGDQTITLTGDVTGTGTGSFATTIGAKAVDVAMLADGTDGELITWSATGVATTVPVGTAAQVLTSNGPGAAPTFQDAGGGGTTYPSNIYVSATTTGAANTVFTFTHNLGITEADLKLGKYVVYLVGQYRVYGLTAFADNYWGGANTPPQLFTWWSTTAPTTRDMSVFQANTVKIMLGSAGGSFEFKLIIKQMY